MKVSPSLTMTADLRQRGEDTQTHTEGEGHVKTVGTHWQAKGHGGSRPPAEAGRGTEDSSHTCQECSLADALILDFGTLQLCNSTLLWSYVIWFIDLISAAQLH